MKCGKRQRDTVNTATHGYEFYMKGLQQLRKENYLITPETNTNLGECFFLTNGDIALKIKKPNKNAYETIPFKKLERMAIERAKRTQLRNLYQKF